MPFGCLDSIMFMLPLEGPFVRHADLELLHALRPVNSLSTSLHCLRVLQNCPMISSRNSAAPRLELLTRKRLKQRILETKPKPLKSKVLCNPRSHYLGAYYTLTHYFLQCLLFRCEGLSWPRPTSQMIRNDETKIVILQEHALPPISAAKNAVL